MKLKTKLATLLLGITSIFALTAAIVTNPNSGNAEAISVSAKSADFDFSKGTFSNNVITWNDGTLKITQKKGSSTTNPSKNYISAPRWYAKHEITFNILSDVKIEYLKITCTSPEYANVLFNSTWTSATCSLNSSTVTVIPNNGETEFTSILSAQSRISSLSYEIQEASSTANLVSISADSTQTEVYQNQELDESAITVTGHYDDGSEKQIYSGWTVECDTSVVATGVTATVKYEGFIDTFTVDVVEIPANKTLQLVTSANELSTGDKIIIVGQTNEKYYANGALSDDYLSSIEVTTVVNNSIVLLDDFELLTVVKTASSYKFVFENGALLSVTAAKKLTNKGAGNAEFTIAINAEDNKATIQSKNETFGRFLYNANTPRFTTYTSDTSTSMLLPYIYKINDGNSAGKYADEFLSTVTCDGQGSITAAEGFWNTESTKFDALSAADKKVFSLAEASESGSVEKCVNRYDAIVSKYGTTVYNDFMSRGIVSPSRAIFKPNIVEDAPITEIIVIASISAVTLIGLFAISKKRKEN